MIPFLEELDFKLDINRRGDTRIESVGMPTVNLELKNPVGIAPTVCHGSAHGMPREGNDAHGPTGPRAHGTFVFPWHTVAYRGRLPREPWHTVGICTPWHTVGACHGTRGRLPRDPWVLATGPVGACHVTRLCLPRDPVAYRGCLPRDLWAFVT